jgi:hypothetical protein
MTNAEVQEKLKAGDYGLLTFDKTSTLKLFHGRIKYVDSSGTIFFKDTDNKCYLILAEEIRSFQPKEMLPRPTEHKGREIYWEGGRHYYKENGKECDIDR